MNLPSGKLMALVAVFAAIGVITGTGAFTTVTAERTASVSVSGDASALLALGPTQGPNGIGGSASNQYSIASNNAGSQANYGSGSGSQGYAGYTGSGTLEISLNGFHNSQGSAGVNKNAKTTIKNVFVVSNQGSQKVNVSISDLDYNDPTASNPSEASNPEDDMVNFYFIKANGKTVSLEDGNATVPSGDQVVVSIKVDTTIGTADKSDENDGLDLIDAINIEANAAPNANSNVPNYSSL